jgi:large subunit ribosomal protein L21
MLKKLRKTLSKEIKHRYEKMEGRYLGLENRIYTTIEDRLTLLESKFDDLSELIKDEVRFRKERNEDKLEDIGQDDDGAPFSETVEEVKEIFDETIKDTKEKVKEAKEAVTEKVGEARKLVASKLKKGKKAKAKAEKEIEKKVKVAAKKVKEVAEEIENNDLTVIKGLGEKMAEKLKEEGVTSFQQLARMTEKEVNALDGKIKSFAARFNRYEWDKQAKEQ